MRLLRLPARLREDERGATIVEFAVVAPVMGLLLLGSGDIAHTLYTRGVIQGVIQKTARDSALESGTEAEVQKRLDDRVKAQVKAMANNADIKISRRYYRTFSEASIAKAETWSDTNTNGICDAGEPYEDSNGNASWDRDGGNGGQGGAKDAVLYTVEVSYPRMFPLYNFTGGSKTTKITASTVLKNQPYSDQGTYDAPQVRNCL